MSATGQLQGLAAELDELVYLQDFPAVATCAVRLAELARNPGGAITRVERAELAAESMRAIETARRKLCVARTRIAECLVRAERSAEYCDAPAATVHTLAVQG